MNVYLEIDDTLEESLTLWRYMDLAKLVSLLEKSAIWLARADTFRDQHEGRFPYEMQDWIERAFKKFPDSDPSPVKNANDFQDYLIKNTFVSCWHKNLDENMVMWELYGRDTNAVAVQTTVGSIKESINPSALSGHSLLLKPVTYARPEDTKGVLPYEECVFRKRPHFAFEREVRISLDTYSPASPTKDTPYGYQLPVFISNLINAIYVHPDSPQWFVDVVNSITKQYEVHAEVRRGAFGNK